jgi:hypothetical protein
MSTRTDEPRTRHERLAQVAEEYTEEIHYERTRHQLAGVEPVSRFAAVTSEGSPESNYASNGNLIVADSGVALAEQLRRESGEGWLAHGRVWDLDAPWHLWGNLEVAYSVRVGEDVRRPVYLVSVAGREHGVSVFEISSTPRPSRRPSASMVARPSSPSSWSTTTAPPTG